MIGAARPFNTAIRRTITLARYLWALPNTVIGLTFVPLALRGGSARIVDGALEVHGPMVAWVLRNITPLAGGAAAVTFGHVIAGQSPDHLEVTRVHEHIHVRQYERWGPLFIPAYLVAGACSWLRGSGGYWGNRFEREARAQERLIVPTLQHDIDG